MESGYKSPKLSQAWLSTPFILTLERQRQRHLWEFEASQSYMVRLHIRNKPSEFDPIDVFLQQGSFHRISQHPKDSVTFPHSATSWEPNVRTLTATPSNAVFLFLNQSMLALGHSWWSAWLAFMKTWVPSLAPPHKSDTCLYSQHLVETGRSEFKVLLSHVSHVGGSRPCLKWTNKMRYLTKTT